MQTQNNDSLQASPCINNINPALDAAYIDWIRVMHVLTAVNNNNNTVFDDVTGDMIYVKFVGVHGMHGKGRTQEVIIIPDDKQAEGQYSFKLRPIRVKDGRPYLSIFEVGDEVVLKDRSVNDAIEHYNHQQHFYAQKQILAKLDMEK